MLGQRYYQGERPKGGEGAIPSSTPSVSGEAVTQRSQYLPLVLTNGEWLWYKGTGKSKAYPQSGFLIRLRGSWWYDWQHDYTSPWWQKFLQQLRLYHSDVKIDGLAIHAYPWGSSVRDCWNYQPVPDIWEDCMQGELERNRNDFRAIGAPLVPDAPLWITETGYLGIPTEVSPPLTMQQVQDYVMDPMIVWLQSGNTGYQSVAWFISIDNPPPYATNLFEATLPQHTPSAMTILGARWATVTPVPPRVP